MRRIAATAPQTTMKNLDHPLPLLLLTEEEYSFRFVLVMVVVTEHKTLAFSWTVVS